MPDNTVFIANIEDAIELVRTRLASFAEAQDENSDEANEDNIQEAEQALDNLETIIGSLIP